MKKYLISLILALAINYTNTAYAIFLCNYETCRLDTVYDSSCNQADCTICTNRTMGPDLQTGLVTHISATYKTNCPSVAGGIATCECEQKYTYECGEGYYGTATAIDSVCTACPDNATCAGGNGSTFVCDQGYYKNSAQCTKCPSSGLVEGTTAAAGATGITDCYIPKNRVMEDSAGSYHYSSDCYYTK